MVLLNQCAGQEQRTGYKHGGAEGGEWDELKVALQHIYFICKLDS